MSTNFYPNKDQVVDLINEATIPILGGGGGFAPIGTRAYFDGTLAPEGWLLCDGSTHNITDYPELASYFASHHGSSNCYGGNGTTTFATPVMNGMPNGGVETPDEHIVGEWREEVDGVLKFKPIYRKKFELSSPITISNSSPTTLSDIDGSSIDRIFESSSFTGTTDYNCPLMMIHDSGNQDVKALATRANNTISGKIIDFKYTKSTDSWQTVQEGHSSDGNGVFCIKATVAGDPNAHQYSTEEQVVSKWIDGSDIYERTVTGTTPSSSGEISLTGFSNIDVMYITELRVANSYGYTTNVAFYENNNAFLSANVNASGSNVKLYFAMSSSFASKPFECVVRYRKTQS